MYTVTYRCSCAGISSDEGSCPSSETTPNPEPSPLGSSATSTEHRTLPGLEILRLAATPTASLTSLASLLLPVLVPLLVVRRLLRRRLLGRRSSSATTGPKLKTFSAAHGVQCRSRVVAAGGEGFGDDAVLLASAQKGDRTRSRARSSRRRTRTERRGVDPSGRGRRRPTPRARRGVARSPEPAAGPQAVVSAFSPGAIVPAGGSARRSIPASTRALRLGGLRDVAVLVALELGFGPRAVVEPVELERELAGYGARTRARVRSRPRLLAGRRRRRGWASARTWRTPREPTP